MTRKLYDLCSASPTVRFSRPCWLAKFALLHKQLEFDTVPLRFTEKENYPDPEYGLLPVLDDDGEIVRDSAEIIAYLDKKYPENPFFNSEGERAAADFVNAFLGAHLFSALAPFMFIRVHKVLAPEDQVYFRETREKRFGVTLEALAADEALPGKITAALTTLGAPLQKHDFFGGEKPNMIDYQVASPLMWKRSITTEELYETPDTVAAWFERILDLYDGYCRKAASAG